MGRLGFGFGASRGAASLPPGTGAGLMTVVEPGVAWTGIEGSGFATLAPPTDPARVTAKPAIRLITPPRQWFTDRQLVGVVAMANDNGTLMNNLGLEKVVLHYEGNSADVLHPTFQTFRDANGIPRTYFGWWAWLQHDGRNGFGHVYFEAIPRDTTMQRRVIGPFLYAAQPAKHLIELQVAPSLPEIPGQRFQSLNAASAWCKANPVIDKNPRITIMEPGLYEMLENTGGSRTTHKGYITVEVAEGVEASIGRTEYTTDTDAKIRNNSFPWCFRGANLTIDLHRVTELTGTTMALGDGMHWLDGCRLTSTSPEGRYEMQRGGPIHGNGGRILSKPWMTEVEVSHISGAFIGASLARGCTANSITYDIAAGVRACIDCVITDHSTAFYYVDHPMLEVTYTGSASTATIRRTGGADANGVTFWFEWGGQTRSFVTGSSFNYYTREVGDGYSATDLVNWINSELAAVDPGWSATLTADPDKQDWRAARISTAGRPSSAFDATNVKNTTVGLFTRFARHSDFFQHATGLLENIVFWGNVCDGVEVQAFFLGPIAQNGVPGQSYDMMFVNNIVRQNSNDATALSQYGKGGWTGGHLVFVHNTMVNQKLVMRSDSTNWDIAGYALTACNALEGFAWFGGGVPDPDMVVKDNHFHDGQINLSGAAGTSAGGNPETLFGNYLASDFRPAGLLLENLKTPVVPYDRTHLKRAELAPAGALTQV
ncbi:hypothetical protein [Altererythrobacter lauratis]|uniref:Right-handed parallel beta-helix repeat-containing protein n=1 Tax=Alteraurantiacibacter lauratis TaxID=2054627 RepID=A0ABV7EC96_9SPHN